MSYVHYIALVGETAIAATVFHKTQTEKIPNNLQCNICTCFTLK